MGGGRERAGGGGVSVDEREGWTSEFALAHFFFRATVDARPPPWLSSSRAPRLSPSSGLRPRVTSRESIGSSPSRVATERVRPEVSRARVPLSLPRTAAARAPLTLSPYALPAPCSFPAVWNSEGNVPIKTASSECVGDGREGGVFRPPLCPRRLAPLCLSPSAPSVRPRPSPFPTRRPMADAGGPHQAARWSPYELNGGCVGARARLSLSPPTECPPHPLTPPHPHPRAPAAPRSASPALTLP